VSNFRYYPPSDKLVHRPEKIVFNKKNYRIVDVIDNFQTVSKIFKTSSNTCFFIHLGIEFPISMNSKYSCYEIYELSPVEEALL
jgi:hypothetical protein